MKPPCRSLLLKGSMERSYRYCSIQRGFTFVEVIVVIAIIGILLAIAAPATREYILDARISTQGTELVSDLMLARSEAVSRGRSVTVCASTDGASCSGSGNDWALGRIIFVDGNNDGVRQNTEQLLRTGASVSSDTTIVSAFANNSYVRFWPYGGSLSRGTFNVCLNDFSRGRQVTVEMTGRSVVGKVAC